MPHPSLERRAERRHRIAQSDQRGEFERDRDRILYCSAFRRLGGITQIVRAGEADVFHTRLAHTLKVAQVGRRLAQHICASQPTESSFFGVDPEVVEAACLAHDLGHPPFGHLGEEVLDELTMSDEEGRDPDGFEGNAQSFRVVTKLALRFDECHGLDLTRGTLSACLKYPWTRETSDPKKKRKFGAYGSELKDLEFARLECDGECKTAEAELMDWADDIAYSVHDLEDFTRCRVIPWDRIFEDREPLVASAKRAWRAPPPDADGRLRDAHRDLSDFMKGLVPDVIQKPYEATREQRMQIRVLTSKLIGRYIRAIALVKNENYATGRSPVVISDDEHDQVRILKQITRDYVIENPILAAQQRGHKRILADLYADLMDDLEGGKPKYLPRKFAYLVRLEDVSRARTVADCIASLTEAETVALHGRLRGYSSGSVLDPIVR